MGLLTQTRFYLHKLFWTPPNLILPTQTFLEPPEPDFTYTNFFGLPRTWFYLHNVKILKIHPSIKRVKLHRCKIMIFQKFRPRKPCACVCSFFFNFCFVDECIFFVSLDECIFLIRSMNAFFVSLDELKIHPSIKRVKLHRCKIMTFPEILNSQTVCVCVFVFFHFFTFGRLFSIPHNPILPTHTFLNPPNPILPTQR